MTVRAIVTDIEGTTSAITFVHDVLFPYAARELPAFIAANAGDDTIAALLDATRADAGEPDASVERVVEILLGWIAEDRKAAPLKTLQGHIWRAGYINGDFTGHLYDDVVEHLKQWSARDIRLFVYSSGSVGAQKLLFGYSDAGDLTPLFEGYFDTAIGHKKEVSAYCNIISEISEDAGDILFLSDVVEELDAARDAGMQTCQLVRTEDVTIGEHQVARTFADVTIEPD